MIDSLKAYAHLKNRITELERRNRYISAKLTPEIHEEKFEYLKEGLSTLKDYSLTTNPPREDTLDWFSPKEYMSWDAALNFGYVRITITNSLGEHVIAGGPKPKSLFLDGKKSKEQEKKEFEGFKQRSLNSDCALCKGQPKH